MLSLDDALSQLRDAARPLAEVLVLPLLAAQGRVLAEDQRAVVSAPPLDNAAMDGYAVRAADIPQAGTRLPVSQRIPAGTVGAPLQAGTAARIFTGAPVPAGADTVIMQEDCLAEGDAVLVQTVPRPGSHIRRAGEDFAAGQIILSAGTRLGALDIALAAAAGLPVLPVYRPLRVGIFFTGDELHQPGEPLPPGGIYNANRYALSALLTSLQCEVEDLGTVPDSLEATRQALRQAAQRNDLIITSGGVSVGEEDHVKPAVEAEGQLDLWKVAIKPGKPLAFGRVRRSGEASGEADNAAWFIGLPGNPVSAVVTFLILVRPFIVHLQGRTESALAGCQLTADFDWSKPDKRPEFLRARREGTRVLLHASQGSGVLSSLSWADGLVANPPQQAIRRGDTVTFLPFSELLG